MWRQLSVRIIKFPERRLRKLNIAVLIRSVVDSRVPLPPDVYGEKPLPEGMISIVNPADWFALECALNLRNQMNRSQIVAIALGGEEAEESLRWCLAAGAERALRIWDRSLVEADQLGRGKAVAAVLTRSKPDLILCGDGCLDQINSLLPGVAASAAGLSYVPGVARIEKVEHGMAVVVRKLEKGKRERVMVKLPALIAIEEAGGVPSCDADLPGLIAAFTQPMPCKGLSCLGLSPERAGSRGAKVNNVMTRVSRPITARPVTPDHRLPAEQRLRKILAGGVVRKQGEVITGTPEQLADRIIEFFRSEPVVML